LALTIEGPADDTYIAFDAYGNAGRVRKADGMRQLEWVWEYRWPSIWFLPADRLVKRHTEEAEK